MSQIFAVEAVRVKKRRSRLFEANSVLPLIGRRLAGIPIEHLIMYILNYGGAQRGDALRTNRNHL